MDSSPTTSGYRSLPPTERTGFGALLRGGRGILVGVTALWAVCATAAPGPNADEVHVFNHPNAADYPKVYALTTDKRHLLLPQVAPAALAIGSNLKVVLFRYAHFVNGPKGHLREPQSELCKRAIDAQPNLWGTCGPPPLYFEGRYSQDLIQSTFHTVLGPGTHTNLSTKDYFSDDAKHRYESMIVFRKTQDMPHGVWLLNTMKQDALAQEVFLPVSERYADVAAVYDDARLAVYGRAVNLGATPRTKSVQVILHPNGFPGTSKPVVVNLKGIWYVPDSTYLDLRARGFHGLSKVQVIDPGIAVLKAVPQTSWFDTAIISGVKRDWSQISGHWDSAIGDMHLGQEGERVNGILIRRDVERGPRTAIIRGSFRDGRLEYTWSWEEELQQGAQPQGQGVLELSTEGGTLSGWYTDRDTEGDKARQSWSLRRREMDQ